jgi:hypothetical protein
MRRAVHKNSATSMDGYQNFDTLLAKTEKRKVDAYLRNLVRQSVFPHVSAKKLLNKFR